jgi:hypothetical protein
LFRIANHILVYATYGSVSDQRTKDLFISNKHSTCSRGQRSNNELPERIKRARTEIFGRPERDEPAIYVALTAGRGVWQPRISASAQLNNSSLASERGRMEETDTGCDRASRELEVEEARMSWRSAR